MAIDICLNNKKKLHVYWVVSESFTKKVLCQLNYKRKNFLNCYLSHRFCVWEKKVKISPRFFVYFYSKIMKHILLSSSFALSVSVFIVIVPM